MQPDTLKYSLVMRQGTQQMLPASAGFMPSTIWGYADGTQDQPNGTNPTLHAPGNAIIVNKNTPAEVTYDSTRLPLLHPLAHSQDWGLASCMLLTSGFIDPILDPKLGTFGPGPGAGLDNRVAVHSHGLAVTAVSDGGPWDFFLTRAQLPHWLTKPPTSTRTPKTAPCTGSTTMPKGKLV